MSYEGYYQALCQNGHDCSDNCYMFDKDGVCEICGGKIVWWNSVDQTNDDGTEQVVHLQPATYKTIQVVDTYTIPENLRLPYTETHIQDTVDNLIELTGSELPLYTTWEEMVNDLERNGFSILCPDDLEKEQELDFEDEPE